MTQKADEMAMNESGHSDGDGDGDGDGTASVHPSISDLCRDDAIEMFEQYVVNNSPFQVNISFKLQNAGVGILQGLKPSPSPSPSPSPPRHKQTAVVPMDPEIPIQTMNVEWDELQKYWKEVASGEWAIT